jgi:uncharacterized Zn finger protein
MTRESAQEKAKRYLREGRLLVTRVDADRVEARVKGDGVIHRLGLQPNGDWWCSCPSPSRNCSHLLALRLVTIVPRRSA